MITAEFQRKYFIFLLFFNTFFPTFNVFFDRTGGAGVIFINFVMVTSLILILSMLIAKGRVRVTNLAVYFLLVFAILLLSVLVTNIYNRNLVFSDVFEIFRPIYYLCCFLYGYQILKNKVFTFEQVVYKYSIFIFLTALFSVVCLVLFEYGGRQVISVYAKDSLVSSRRFAGTFQNPYDFAFISALPIAYFLISFLLRGGYFKLIPISVIFITIAFGQTKSGFVTALITIFSIFIIFPFLFRSIFTKTTSFFRFISFPLMFLLLAFIIYVNFYDNLEYLIDGLIAFSNGGDRSSQMRMEQFDLAYSMLTSDLLHIILGYGSLKDSGLLFESLYSLYPFRYGALSLIFLFSWIILPLFMLCNIKQNSVSLESRVILFLFFFAVLPSGLGNNILDQSRIPFIYFSLLGLLCAAFSVNSNCKEVVSRNC